MPTIDLTPPQFRYLQAAVERDLEMLLDMDPWEIDGQIDEHAADVATCREVGLLFGRVAQVYGDLLRDTQ